ncbi:MAG TPA: purine-nucleoside phosphorylase [Candidatus Eisenbacteria bacterium]
MSRVRRLPAEPAPFDAEEALRVVRRRTSIVPRVGLVLGSGLGVVADGVAWDAALPTAEIPGLPRSTVAGHSGRLLIGRWSGRPVVVAQGRSHLYEGYPAESVTRVVRVMAALGIKSLILTNAAGGIAPRMTPGALMLVEDQVNLQWRGPSRPVRPPDPDGEDAASGAPAGPRGLASRPVYAEELLAKAAHAAVVAGVRLERGVLGVMLGPSYETPAEIAMLERMGADAVCMSTAAEAAEAAALGVPCAAISCITNRAAGKGAARLAHEDVTAAVAAAATPLKRFLERLVLALT